MYERCYTGTRVFCGPIKLVACVACVCVHLQDVVTDVEYAVTGSAIHGVHSILCGGALSWDFEWL